MSCLMLVVFSLVVNVPVCQCANVLMGSCWLFASEDRFPVIFVGAGHDLRLHDGFIFIHVSFPREYSQAQGMPWAYIVDLFLFIIRIIEKRLAPPRRSEHIISTLTRKQTLSLLTTMNCQRSEQIISTLADWQISTLPFRFSGLVTSHNTPLTKTPSTHHAPRLLVY